MKKYLFLLLIIGAMYACQTAPIDEVATDMDSTDELCPEDCVRLNLYSECSRTAYAGGGEVVWCNGDKVKVNDINYTVYVEEGQSFVYVKAADSYKVIYPAEIVSSEQIYLQPAQLYAEDSFGPGANPMYGEGTTKNGVILRSVCGVLKLRLSGDATISSIAVTDNSGEAVCGTFDYADGKASAISDLAHPSVVLNCTKVDGVKLNPAGEDFYIVMPAREYPEGLQISISDTSGRSMKINSATPRTIKVNDILSTPTIAYSPDSDLIFAESFDKFVWGSDRAGKRAGFANPKGASATGYEFATAKTSASEYGTVAISTTWNTAQQNDLSVSYIKSRALTDWDLLFQCREVYGAMAVGHLESHRGILRFPRLANIPKGEVCKASLTFKLAFKDGSNADPLLVYAYASAGPGVPIAYYVDGEQIDIPKDGAYWTSSQNLGFPIPLLTTSTMSNEKLIINNPLNNEIRDYDWHTIRIDFGAVTSETIIAFQSYSAHSPLSEFFIDDIEIRKIPYPFQDDAEHYVVSKGTENDPSKLMLPLSVTISTGGSWMSSIKQFASAGVEYIDIGLGYSNFFDVTQTEGGYGNFRSDCLENMKALKAKFDAAGLKIWHIHLPGIGSKYTKQSDGTYAAKDHSDPVDFANTTSSIRKDAVSRMLQIIEAVEVLDAEYLLIHPSGYNDGGPEDKYYYTTLRKAALVASLKDLVPAAQSIGSTLVIENLGNYKSAANSLTIKPEYINYFTTQVPGLKFGFDFSHGTVDNINDGAQFIRDLNPDILKVLHVHGGGNDRDVHLIPGYSGIYQYHDHLKWGEIYTELIKYGYRGPFTYEPGSYAPDCNASYSNIIHNYYEYVYPEYRKAQQ